MKNITIINNNNISIYRRWLISSKTCITHTAIIHFFYETMCQKHANKQHTYIFQKEYGLIVVVSVMAMTAKVTMLIT